MEQIELDISLKLGNFQLQAALKTTAAITGIFGPSGAGKTGLLNSISGLARPQQGKIRIGNDIIFNTQTRTNTPTHRRSIACVFQDYRLFPHLTVEQNLLYGYRNIPASKRRFMPETIIDLLELRPHLSRPPRNLSGGEKQRVALGRAILYSPRLLLMDEPLSALDENLKGEILNFLKQISLETKIPIIYVSHSLREILQLTDTLAVLSNGRILRHGSFLEIIKHDEVLKAIQSREIINLLPVRTLAVHKKDGICEMQSGNQRLVTPLLPLAAGEESTISVGAEDISISLDRVPNTSIQNQLKGKFVEATHGALYTLLHIDIGHVLLLVKISRISFKTIAPQKGQTLFCLIKAQSIQFPAGR